MITNLSPCLLGGETALWEQGIPYLVAMFHVDHHVRPQLLTPKRCFLTDVVIWSQVMDRYLGWLGMVGWNRWNPLQSQTEKSRKAQIHPKSGSKMSPTLNSKTSMKIGRKKSTRKWRKIPLWVAQGDAPRVFTNKAWYSKATGPRTNWTWKSLIDWYWSWQMCGNKINTDSDVFEMPQKIFDWLPRMLMIPIYKNCQMDKSAVVFGTLNQTVIEFAHEQTTNKSRRFPWVWWKYHHKNFEGTVRIGQQTAKLLHLTACCDTSGPGRERGKSVHSQPVVCDRWDGNTRSLVWVGSGKMLVEMSLITIRSFSGIPRSCFWHSADWFTQIISFWTRLEECMASSKGKFLPIPKAHWTSSRDTMNPPALEDSKKLEPVDLTCNRRRARV